MQVQGLARRLARGLGEHAEDLLYPVRRQRRLDGSGVPTGALDVEAVHGELVGAAATHEPGRPIVLLPGPHLRVRGRRLQHGHQARSHFREPRRQIVARRRVTVRGLLRARAFAQHVSPEPGELAQVPGEVGQRPVRAGGHPHVEGPAPERVGDDRDLAPDGDYVV